MADRTFFIKKNRDDAIRVLKIVIDTLDEYNIDYYLDFGTLIGAVREKALIPWDDDIDISLVNECDYSKIPDILKLIKKKHSLRTYILTFQESYEKLQKKDKVLDENKVSFTKNSNFQIAKIRTNKFWIFGRGNTCLDIFFKYKFNNKSCWVACRNENSVPLEYMSEDLTEIDFCGIKCNIPKNYDKYLTFVYGDWKIPQKDWDESQSNTLT